MLRTGIDEEARIEEKIIASRAVQPSETRGRMMPYRDSINKNKNK